jgi:hypothetical protein
MFEGEINDSEFNFPSPRFPKVNCPQEMGNEYLSPRIGNEMINFTLQSLAADTVRYSQHGITGD